MGRRRAGRPAVLLVLALAIAACGSGATTATDQRTAGPAGSAPTSAPGSPNTSAAGAAAGAPQAGGAGPSARWVAAPSDNWPGHGFDPANPAGCDPLDPAQCLLPYPNDWFTKPDATSATGRRLDLTLLGMPHNAAGKPIEPQEWNRSDGFSAGAQILTLVPGMTSNADLVPSGLPPVTDLAMNTQPNLGVVLLDVQTGRRVPVWVEIDQYTDEAGLVSTGSVQQDLMIHPAANLTDGHRYIVALRHLVRDDKKPAQPSAAFIAYRDGTASSSDPRRAHMENVFRTLQRAGVSRKDLYLAWDFTTASTRNVTGRLLAIRKDAFHQLADNNLADGKVEGNAPAFTVDSVSNYTTAQNSRLARQVTGHLTVPCYIAPTCSPPAKCAGVTGGAINDCPSPGQFALDPSNPDAVPSQVAGQTYQANFICNVGRSGFENHQLLRPVEYGHGLFGGAGEVNSDPQQDMASRFGMMYCATDWFGWASADTPNAAVALADLSRFPLLTDEAQQGELDFLYLARLMIHPQGFGSDKAFQFSDGTSFIDTHQAYYDGNSQGGIFGGTVCAVSVDLNRCVLGVSGMDYSILLPRSSDYVAKSKPDPTKLDPSNPRGLVGFSTLFDSAYPDQSQRILIFDLIQTLWDRSDPNGYAGHMTGGLPDTPSHNVLLQIGYGDHQVANITAEDEARTIGAHGVYPPLVTARYGPYHDVFWSIAPVTSFPYSGSAIVLFDTGPAAAVLPGGHHGTDPPPPADVPNRSGEDPHEAPRRAPWGQVQKSDFLSVGGVVTNPQPGGAPYFAWGWDGITGL
ncbi:MAG: hypothetical protein E6J14_11045 [Chloroflexi bacterium]|nr:MAG: hypothetical protein E6J14_11045 [Chloroflexota bacterium]